MKIRVEAAQLMDTDIEMVSLVKRGANRSPFKVMKSEDRPSIGGTIKKMFKLGNGEAKANCFYVLKSVADKILPVLAKSGVKIDDVVDNAGILMLKQEGYEPHADVTLIQMNPAVGVAVSNLQKDLMGGYTLPAQGPSLEDSLDEGSTDDFAQNLAREQFYPGLYMAIDTLEDTLNVIVGDLDGDADDGTDSAGGTASVKAKATAAAKAFSAYVNNLIDALPSDVTKAEKSLQREFGPSSLNFIGKAMDPPKTKAKPDNLNAAVDLAADPETAAESAKDPNDEESEQQKMAKSGYDGSNNGTTKDNVVETGGAPDPKKMKATQSSNTTTPTELNDRDGVEKAMNGGDPAGKGTNKVIPTGFADLPQGGAPLSPAGTGKAPTDGYTRNEDDEPNDKEKADDTKQLFVKMSEIAGALGNLAKTVSGLMEITKAQGEQIAAVQKSATESIKKSERTAVVYAGVDDTAYDSMGGTGLSRRPQSGRVMKSGHTDDVWAGTGLDVLAGHSRED